MKYISKFNLYSLIGILAIFFGVTYYASQQQSKADSDTAFITVTIFADNSFRVSGALTDFTVTDGAGAVVKTGLLSVYGPTATIGNLKSNGTYSVQLTNIRPTISLVAGETNPRTVTIGSNGSAEVRMHVKELSASEVGSLDVVIKGGDSNNYVGRISVSPERKERCCFLFMPETQNAFYDLAPRNDYTVTYDNLPFESSGGKVDIKYELDPNVANNSATRTGVVIKAGEKTRLEFAVRAKSQPSPVASAPTSPTPTPSAKSTAKATSPKPAVKASASPSSTPSTSPSPTAVTSPVAILWEANYQEKTTCSIKADNCTENQKSLIQFLAPQAAPCFNRTKEKCSSFEQFFAKLFKVKKYPLAKNNDLNFTTTPQPADLVTDSAKIGICLQAKKGTKQVALYRLDLTAKATNPQSLTDFLAGFKADGTNTIVTAPKTLTACLSTPS